METWLLLRLVKFLGMVFFAAGVGLAAGSPTRAGRVRGAWVVAPLGFVLTWLSGYGMLKVTGASMGAGWVSASMLGSIVAVGAAVWASEAPSPARAVLAWAGLGAAVAAMVVRDGAGGALAVALAAAGAGVLGLLLRVAPTREDGRGELPEAFWWWTRLEATSAALLMLVYMPLKYGAGVVLDGGQGWFGWVHGVLTVLFVAMLPSAARLAGWRPVTAGVAFVAALVPLGGFWFERWVSRAEPARA